MNRTSLHIASGLLVALAASTLTWAAVAPEEAAKLGTTLTPIGAERSGNAAGTIPPWEGGLTKTPPGIKAGTHYPDPFIGEKPLFVVDQGNVDRYRDNLSPGQIAMIKKYAGYKIRVFATHRTAAYPQKVYEQSRANATAVQLAADGNGFSGTTGGIPFPIPKSGVEVVWNHNSRYRGDTYVVAEGLAGVQRDGSFTVVRAITDYDYHYGSLVKADKDRVPNMMFKYFVVSSAPARLAGTATLIYETVDQAKQPRQTWTYNPGQRRVRLSPAFAYDTPLAMIDGIRTIDDYWMFNGATDRYDWKLVGKKEMFIPYNAYAINSNSVAYKDVVRPGHVNSDLARYELHRVWVVEATLKEGASHIYGRRTFYVDEDSWQIALVDKYDTRGQLWRVSEAHNYQLYDLVRWHNGIHVHYDLQSGRFAFDNASNEEAFVYKTTSRDPQYFTPDSMRSVGIR